MGKQITRLAETVAARTSRRDFLGWLGRSAAALAAILGCSLVGPREAAGQVAPRCTAKSAWEFDGATAGPVDPNTGDPTALSACGCNREEAYQGLLAALRAECGTREPSAANNPLCKDRNCTGSEKGPVCKIILKGIPSIQCVRVAAGTPGCPTCPTGGETWKCEVKGIPTRATCECDCDQPQGKKPCQGEWSIYRHLAAANENVLRTSAVVACQNAGNAVVCRGRRCENQRRPRCDTVADYSPKPVRGGGVEIDGKITCSCTCV